MIRACECMPSLGELTNTRCPGCNFCSMRTRAPWALTFSVSVLSLSFASSCRQTSTVNVLAIRLSDRPFDIVLLVPQSLRALGSMLTVRASRFPMGTFVSLRSVVCFNLRLSKRGVSFRSFGSKNSVPALRHFLPVASQYLTTIVQLSGQAEENCNFPAGDLLSTL